MFVNGLRSCPRTAIWVGALSIVAVLGGCAPDLAAGDSVQDPGAQSRVETESPANLARQGAGIYEIPEDEETSLAALPLEEESAQNVYVHMSGQWLEQHMSQGLTQDSDGVTQVGENVSAILALQSLGYEETAWNLATELREPQLLDVLVGPPEALQVGDAAQVIVALAAVGTNPANSGERDLLSEVEVAMTLGSGTTNASALEQAWAMIALAYSGQPNWVGFEQFISAQCDDGGFPKSFDTSEPCTGDVRVTARVLSALTLSLNVSPQTDVTAYDPISREAVGFLNQASQKSADGTVFWVNPKTKSPSLELTSAATVALADASTVHEGTADFLFNRLASATDGGAVTVNGKPNVAATAQTLIGLTAAGLSQF